jgi:signal transduction histidine kinase/CheY-like chemotaxis protein
LRGIDLPADRLGALEMPLATENDAPGLHDSSDTPQVPASLSWSALSRTAQMYVAVVMIAGLCAVVAFLPRAFPEPLLFTFLLVAGCVTSVWKVTLPIPLASGSTLSVSSAADLMTLLLLGPQYALVVAVTGVWTQSAFKTRVPHYPAYRTLFNMAAEAITMAATGSVYVALGGPLEPVDLSLVAKPLVGAIAVYFVVNTGLVAGAISLSSERTWFKVWRDDFLWSSASFMVAGSAGAAAAIVIARGEHWKALLMLAPVYLTYRTYQVFVGRLEDQQRHTAETQRLHQKTVDALMIARRAEQALAAEKERLAATVAELTRLERARKELLHRERAARTSAEEASRLKDQFLAMVSHELRTPLNAIVGWADMLRSGRLDPADRGRAAEAIYGNSHRQARMIDELLDVARITSGKLRLERSAVDLLQVVRAAIEVVQVAADAKRVRIDVIANPDLGGMYGDAARLQQIAWNLLSNAVKFTPEHGTVVVRLRRVNNIAEMVVSDTGAGIPAEFLPWVFEAFQQADASTTRPYGGLGLGLSIVKHLVEAHGGSVSVASSGEGQGSTFTVRLPVVAAAMEPLLLPAGVPDPDELAHAEPSLAGIRVLVVDDDRESRDVVAANLTSRHATVTTAGSAAQALAVLEHERMDVLLADIAMPGEDGYSLIRKIRAASSESAAIPAAALTALARDEDRRQALDAGFQLHLAKPIDPSSLVAAVASLGRA